MRPIRKSLVLVFTTLALGSNVTIPGHAQAAREELQQFSAQLQKTPSDSALREKVIKLAETLKPPPAIPEEARKPFVMGAALLKKASGPADAAKAAEWFTTAIEIAPWFADAYYNRAVARETAGQFSEAMDNLKTYLLFKLPAQERREVQDKIYALEVDAQLAATKKVEEEKVRLAAAVAERERARPTVEGIWDTGSMRCQVVREGERYAVIGGTMLGVKAPITWRGVGVTGDRQHLQFQGAHDNPGIRMHRFELTLSADGKELAGWAISPAGERYSVTFKRIP